MYLSYVSKQISVPTDPLYRIFSTTSLVSLLRQSLQVKQSDTLGGQKSLPKRYPRQIPGTHRIFICLMAKDEMIVKDPERRSVPCIIQVGPK